jgi:hypothetical protein
MVAVRVNGSEAPVASNPGMRVTDLVELIKNSIDPAHMVTTVKVNGGELEAEEWDYALDKFGPTPIFEFDTGTPGDYVKARVQIAPMLIQAIYMGFRDARKSFQSGDMQSGNKAIFEAVNDLKAFLEWYHSLCELVKETDQNAFSITTPVEEITTVCKKICQQQLYQSWWALGETIAKELEPALDRLEDFFRKLGQKQ